MKKTNSIKFLLLIILAVVTISACSSDDKAAPPAADPREVFIGAFQLEPFVFDYLNFDSSAEAVPFNVEYIMIQFSKDGQLDENELYVDLNGFIKELFLTSDVGFTQDISVLIENPEPATAKISGSDFSIVDFQIPVQISFESFSATIDCVFNADGQLTEGKLTMNFTLLCDVDGDPIKMTGTTIGNKE